MSILQLYLLVTLLPNLRGVSNVLCIFLGLAFVGAAIGFLSEPIEITKGIKKLGITIFVIWVLSVIMSLCIPNEKQLALIYGGSYLSNNQQVTTLPPKLLDLIHKYLDESLTKK